MCLGPPAAVSFPARFHYRDGCESVQISTPVVPEQRSGGRQPPRTCRLFTATPSAHKTGKSRDLGTHKEEVWDRAGGLDSHESEGGGAAPVGLAKEVKLTSLKIFGFCLALRSLRFTYR